MLIEYAFILTTVFFLGAVVGSWLNVCIHRLGKDERFWPALKSLVYPPSHCPRCKSGIAWYDNVPVLGWMWLRGRCRNCRGWISIRYPLVELATGLLFALIYWSEIPPQWHANGGTLFHAFGPATLYNATLTIVHIRMGLHLVLLCALIVATMIDFDLRIIPDTVTLPAMLTAILVQAGTGIAFVVPLVYQTPEMSDSYRTVAHAVAGGSGQAGFLHDYGQLTGMPDWIVASPHLHGLMVSLSGLLLGGGVVWGVRLVGGWILKQEAMGFGDVVLMAMIGSFVGWQGTIAVFMMAPLLAVLGSLVPMLFRKTQSIPYGPYLSLATILLLVGFPRVWPPLESGILALGPLLPAVALIMLVALAVMLGAWGSVKRRMGWGEVPPPEFVEEWLPGDQLAYLAMEKVDPQQGQWQQKTWPGSATGRGQFQYNQWKGH